MRLRREGFGARAARGKVHCFSKRNETKENEVSAKQKRAPGAPSSAVPSRGVSQTIKPFVSLRASVRLDGMENHASTIGVLGCWLLLSQHGGILLYRHTGESRYPEHLFGWHCRWIPAYAGMTSLLICSLMYLTVAIDLQCIEGNTST
jgi:hypothetical protein